MSKSGLEKEEWKELNNVGVLEFKAILSAIEKFHSLALKSEKTKGSGWEFKRDLLKSENIRVFFKSTEDKHVFLIRGEIYGEGKTRSEEFVLIDGIQEARDVFEKQGITHPVFSINCFNDIIRDHTL
ncbi:LIC_13246 family protein [Leptospira alstonii]|uniref:Uncharacterized protein n=2 Tax=Leptospira alstonii TaxID=28452 RepID=M6CNF4_9LEPT|nr:hypothetical protein [Leptospira alstonii]EMJ93452.1 hypothetical protein LEP1GSC194_2332 [Leptospira alstonii serovar Sichuan str. 79601]EQA80786.1 hypothetical protein LEP1GSC193_0329 [Leptospira alstonii serovar Pingchang str. 80-412]